jgi:hypothetical protein
VIVNIIQRGMKDDVMPADGDTPPFDADAVDILASEAGKILQDDIAGFGTVCMADPNDGNSPGFEKRCQLLKPLTLVACCRARRRSRVANPSRAINRP